MVMMELINILRAKDNKSEKYLLKEHALETLKRLEQYYKYVKNNNEAIKYDALNNGQRDDLFKNLAKALFLHDTGKIDYNFQKKVFDYEKERKYDDKEQRYVSEDWGNIEKFFSGIKEIKDIRHEILSSLWSTFLLENTDWNKKIRTAILLHHYNEYYLNEKDLMEIIVNYKDVEKYLKFINENKNEILGIINGLKDYINNNTTSEFVKHALNEIKASETLNDILNGIKEHDDDISKLAEFYEINNEKPDYDFLVLLGILRRCDYSASGEVPIESEIKSMNEIFKDISENIKKKVKTEKLWQTNILEKHKDNNLILVAPTGSGKTEFALLWAKEMKRKLIYTIPLRVALNDLFIRFRDEKGGYFDKNYVDILHSTSFIEYVNEEKSRKGDDIESKVNSSKMFSSPVILTTPDQVFLTSLNFYGSDKLISLYPTSSIVLDEIQTYNEEMAAIILKTLQIINKLVGNTLIITATFPPYFKKFFDELKYTMIDLKDEDVRKDVKNYELKRHKLKVFESSLFKQIKNDEDNKKNELNKEVEKIIDENKKSKNILIVVNNVRKAIEIYKKLENNDSYLLHSRLLEKEKTRRIQEIKDKLKKGERGMVVVATQIVEASVDIDFDILITEISTIDSQIQRWGRIYRNRESNYNGEPNINIFVGEKNENGKHEIDKATKYIYDEKVIQETINVLKKYGNGEVLNYEKEREMIENTFESKINGKTLKDTYEERIKEILDYLKYFTVEKKSHAQRLFRNIAGTQIIVPQLIENNEFRKFADIIQNDEKKDDSWEEIIKDVEGIKERDIEGNDGKEIIKRKWELKKILYEYSINIPIYYLEKYHYKVISYEFKGYNVLKIDDKILKKMKKTKDEVVENIRKYGIDDYLDSIKNIEDFMEESMMSENII